MSDDLIERLRGGCVCRARRWSGDTHDDLGGTVDEAATDALLAEAAAALTAERDAVVARADAAEAEVARLREALAPFVTAADSAPEWCDLFYKDGACLCDGIRPEEVERARAAIRALPVEASDA